MFFVVIFFGYFHDRAAQNETKHNLLGIEYSIIAWLFFRYIKYHTSTYNPIIYIESYSYHVFLLFIVYYWVKLVLSLDIKEKIIITNNKISLDKLILTSVIFLIISNSSHQLLFNEYVLYDGSYTYSLKSGFIVYESILIGLILISITIVFIKSLRYAKRRMLYITIGTFILGIVFIYTYQIGIPFSTSLDMTIIICSIWAIYIWLAILYGLIPANLKHAEIFKNSKLSMLLLDRNGKISLKSNVTGLTEENLIREVLEKGQIEKDNKLITSHAIKGGHIIWEENIEEINNLKNQIRENIKYLEQGNSILEKEEKTIGFKTRRNEKLDLLSTLEKEIASKRISLSEKIVDLTENDYPVEIRRIKTGKAAALMCYLKRRYQLFFMERENLKLTYDDLIIFLDELAEFYKYADIRLSNTSSIKGTISINRGRLIYDILNSILQDCGSGAYITRMYEEETKVFFSLMMEFKEEEMNDEIKDVLSLIKEEKGNLVTKIIDDTKIYILSFKKEAVK